MVKIKLLFNFIFFTINTNIIYLKIENKKIKIELDNKVLTF